MDEMMFLIFVGLLFTGFLIGYPFGHLFGKREAYQHGKRRVRRYKKSDILNAEVIE